MKEGKLSKGPVLDAIKERSEGLKIANDIKEAIIDYLELKLDEEIELICKWAMELANHQGTRTILKRDWEFIQRVLNDKV